MNLSSSFGTKVINKDDDAVPLFQNNSHATISLYVPLFSYMTMKIRSKTSMIYSKQIFNNELDLIGGLNSIRGFDELSLPVSSYSILNTELRYLFEQQSALFVFYDAAYFEKRYTLDDSYNYAMGFGAGLDLKTGAGVFSIVFAVGKQNQSSFQFNAAKIHFGYKSVF
jgi:hemolysin activation/secretion protein